MKVTATAKGFYGDKIRDEGAEFDYDGPKCSWLKPVEGEWPEDIEEAEEVEKPKRGRPPKTAE
jgi:hypothetical protein